MVELGTGPEVLGLRLASSVLTDDLWPTITRLARRSRRRDVAVAYIGQGAGKILPLRNGDSLVLDMSLPTVASGQTDPREVGRYLSKGVRVFTCSNLHAKIYLLDDALIIGSANVSRRSRDTLVEAGLLTRDRASLSEARGWIRDLQREAVTPGYLKICKRAYKPPRFRTGEKSPSSGGPVPLHSELWLAGVEEMDFDEEEDRICEVAERWLKVKLADPKSYEIDHLRWTDVGLGALGKQGDMVVQIWNRGRSAEVHPPARILGIDRYRKGRRSPVMIHIEESKRVKTIPFGEFRKALRPLGLKRISPRSDFSIKRADQRRAILGLWN